MEQSYGEDILKSLSKSEKKPDTPPYKPNIKEEDTPHSYLYYIRLGNSGNEQETVVHVPFRKRGINKKYSDKYLLNHLKKIAIQLGRTPTARYINEEGIVKATAYITRFGSFTEAVKKAGLAPTKTVNLPKYSDKYLLNHLKKLSKQLGRTPSARYINKEGIVNVATYFKRFGSFNEAVKKAGLVPNK
ncbi:MAG: hypothetical protein ABR968_12520 [Bacteroidales bacterium]|jgi:phage terminase small subunit